MAAAVVGLALAAPAPARAHGVKGAALKAHLGSPTSFATRPAKGTWATCAVSGDVFQVDAETQFADYGGRVYAFCCPDCKPDFEKDPAKYAKK